MKSITTALSFGVCLVCTAAPPMTLTYIEESDGHIPAYREFAGGAWGVQLSASSVASDARWVLARGSAKRAEAALVTASSDLALRIQLSNGVSWGPASVLSPTCGTISTRPFDAVYTCQGGELMTVYRKQSATLLYYRLHTSENPTEQSFNPGLAAAPDWIELSARPGSNEVVAVIAAGSRLHGAVWNGSSWGNFATLTTSLGLYGRPLAVARATGTGSAMVVWGHSGSTSPRYAIWNGSSWSAAASAPSMGSGSATPTIVRLAANPAGTSNELMLAAIDSANRLRACIWNGSAWGTMTSLTSATTNANAYERRVEAAYQPDGARGLVVWHEPGDAAPRFRTWNGSAWSSAGTGPSLGYEARAFDVSPGASGDEVFIAALHRTAPLELGDYVAYTSGGNINANNVIGLQGRQITGVELPPPPGDPSGSEDKAYGNNVTVSLHPGAYRDLTMGNGVTLRMKAGTYVFREWKSSGNNCLLDCDTSEGDTVFIVRNGNVIPGGNNTLRVSRTGPGKVYIHVINGNLEAKNNGSIVNAIVYVYNGNVDLGNNTHLRGALYAKGNINIGSGLVEEDNDEDPDHPPGLSVMRWSGGALGTPHTAAWAMPSIPGRDLSGFFRVMAPTMRVVQWREVGPDDQ